MLTRRDLFASLPLALAPSCLGRVIRAGDGLQASNQSPATSGEDPRFEGLCRKYVGLGLPGVWIAVADKGHLLGISCAGFRDRDRNVPAGLSDRVGYGSITKPFTGLMVATLVAEGKLDYNRQVADYLPDLSSAFEGEKRKITLGQLVTHMAGFPPGPPEPKESYSDGSAYRRQFALNGLAQPLQHLVGSTYEYSNIDITIASLAAEAVAGKPWEQLIHERVAVPLDLLSLAPHPKADDKQVHCYELSASGLKDTIHEEAIQRNWYGPAGSLQGTILDLMRFGLAFLDAKTLPPPIAQSGIYPLLVHAAPGSEVSYCAIASAERPGDNFRLSHGGTLVAGRYRGGAYLRVNSQQGRSVAIATNVYGYGETGEFSKRVGGLVNQMNNEVENYL